MADVHKGIVREKLEGIRYGVAEIPESDEPTADLAASFEADDQLVVEVKSRREDARIAKRLRTTPAGDVIVTQGKISHADDLSDLVHEAAAQIAASQKIYRGLGVFWFRADPALGVSDSAAKMAATLLGTRHVLVQEGAATSRVACCHLATYADFFPYKVIDMAVVDDEKDNSQLLVNPYSPRLEQARASRLFGFFTQNEPGAIIDIAALVDSDTDYVLFGDFSRKDEAQVLEELKKRHPGKEFRFFDMQGFSGFARV